VAEPLTYEGKKLTPAGREKVKEKHFAIPPDRYPIHDIEHARNALVRVRQHGTPEEKSKVYAAVTKKYPALATRSEVVPEKQQRKAEKKVGVGKGEESMKLEAPKQKISSVVVGAFADEVGEIEKVAIGQAARGLQAAAKRLPKKGLAALPFAAGEKPGWLLRGAMQRAAGRAREMQQARRGFYPPGAGGVLQRAFG